MISSSMIPLFVIIPLSGAFLCPILGKRVKSAVDGLGVMAVLGVFVLSVFAVLTLGMRGYAPLTLMAGNWPAPFGIQMVLDSLTAFMLVTVNFVALLVAIYSVSYMEKYTAKWKYFTLFLLMLAGMNGVIITGDIFNLFVFLEVASIASYALVAFGTDKHELEAAFKYAVMGSIGSLFILMGITFLYAHASTLNMADMASRLGSLYHGRIVASAAMVLFLVGFGFKSALVPFHAWLPDAHPSAPAPISAMLSGVLIKSLGVYAICRLAFNVFGIDPDVQSILMALGALSMAVGVVLALYQWDMKRLLAYHSISQIGYIVLGLGIGTPLGIMGGLLHLFNHSVFKSLLFLNSGAVEYSVGSRNLKEMGGLSQRMPVTSWTTLSASMSISGVPPFAGFWSKLLIIMACVQEKQWVYGAIAVAVSILTLMSFMKVTRYAFLGTIRDTLRGVKEVPAFMRLAMVGLAIVCIVGGLLLLPGVREMFLGSASSVLSGGIVLPGEMGR
jgi:multicomponent Na+:H+ antiporter subunit D